MTEEELIEQVARAMWKAIHGEPALAGPRSRQKARAALAKLRELGVALAPGERIVDISRLSWLQATDERLQSVWVQRIQPEPQPTTNVCTCGHLSSTAGPCGIHGGVVLPGIGSTGGPQP